MHMKKLLLLIAALFGVVVLAGCMKKPVADDVMIEGEAVGDDAMVGDDANDVNDDVDANDEADANVVVEEPTADDAAVPADDAVAPTEEAPATN